MSERQGRQVYLLSARDLSPETIAVTFAKTSRSPQSFREIAAGLTDEASSAFHEKWVVGYGHASVAEHAVLHIAFENVSRLAVEAIESSRLASYTEKSTRYQVWSPEGYHLPEEVIGTSHEQAYRSSCNRLMATYAESLSAVRRVAQERHPRNKGESDERWDARIRSRYVDVCRFLLPSAVFANVGMTANARVLENALRRLLAHPLVEVRAIGAELKQACLQQVPTLLKYADPGEYEDASRRALASSRAHASTTGHSPISLLTDDPDGEIRVLAAAIYPNGEEDFRQVLERVRGLDEAGRQRIAEGLMGDRGPHDAAPRPLEQATLSVQVTTDQGAYFELKRHRIMTQIPQPLSARLGYVVPRWMEEAGFGERYRSVMRETASDFEDLRSWNPEIAPYIVPNGFNRRVLLTMNLREAFHFCELRAAENAHFSIRCTALELAEAIRAAYPLLGPYLRTPSISAGKTLDEYFVPA
jgi:thymidylate synthase ThyX